MKKVFWFAFLFPLLLSGKNITLQDAIALAKQNNLTLKQQKLTLNTARNSALKSVLSFGPTANYAISNLQFDPAQQTMDEQTTHNISLNQPLFTGGKIFFGNRISTTSYDLNKSVMNQTTISIESQTEEKFYNILRLRSQKESMEKNVFASQLNLEKAEIRLRSGSLSQAEFWNLKAKHLDLEAQFYQLTGQLDNLRLEFANFINLKEKEFHLKQPESVNDERLLLFFQNTTKQKKETLAEQLIETAFAQSPSLQQSKMQTKIQKYQYWMSYGNLLPSLSLGYSKSWMKTNLLDEYNDSGTLSLNFSVPIFPFVDNGLDLLSARQNFKKQKYAEELVSDATELQIKQHINTLITSAKQAYSAKLAYQYAEKSFEQTQIRFQNNVSSTSDLLTSESTKITAQTNMHNTQFEFQKALNNLRTVLGISSSKLNRTVLNLE